MGLLSATGAVALALLVFSVVAAARAQDGGAPPSGGQGAVETGTDGESARDPLPMSREDFQQLGQLMRAIDRTAQLKYLYNPLKDHLIHRIRSNAEGEHLQVDEETLFLEIVHYFGGSLGTDPVWTDAEQLELKEKLVRLVKMSRKRSSGSSNNGNGR